MCTRSEPFISLIRAHPIYIYIYMCVCVCVCVHLHIILQECRSLYRLYVFDLVFSKNIGGSKNIKNVFVYISNKVPLVSSVSFFFFFLSFIFIYLFILLTKLFRNQHKQKHAKTDTCILITLIYK